MRNIKEVFNMLEKKNFMEAQIEINETQAQINEYFRLQIESLIDICKTQQELIIALCTELEKLDDINVDVSKIKDGAI
jgi:hypothetical protein